MKLFHSKKILTEKTNNRENVPSHAVIKVVLLKSNLVENQYRKSILHRINLKLIC